jgi:hypothetical protein
MRSENQPQQKKPKTPKEWRSIRFEAFVLRDLEAYAGIHKLKNENGEFNLTKTLHERYKALLMAEAVTEQLNQQLISKSRDVETWRTYTHKNSTRKIHCEPLKMGVTAEECKTCSIRRSVPTCPYAAPLTVAKTGETLPVGRAENGGVDL